MSIVQFECARHGPRVRTFTGKRFYPLDPRPEAICIEDIAHHLSMLCRWTGATRGFYSVAQHSVYVMRAAPKPFRLAALLHDAPETWINDLNHPVKYDPTMAPYRDIEHRIERAVAEKFGTLFPLPVCIKDIDARIAVDEAMQLLNPLEAAEFREDEPDLAPLGIEIECWLPEVAEATFLNEFTKLANQRVEA